ncbi:MAG: hypothetical protein F4Z58_13360 [Acidimicrobiaceae bacterium]|nr:hypothetical protein [Acidimicrobiaceae bacterium]MYD05662.1 hypothetical protein [Acidimicrobiaceae bacterium]MYI57687.1 hypothetical protein [Acidimicrobiaceae bacterium]
MSDALARDQPETESLEPDQELIKRRHVRDEQDYRDRCENSYGMVTLGQEEFHPADILDKLAPDAARRGRDEASVQVRRDLEQIVREQFPAPIAAPFQGYLEGTLQPLQRLYRLRDSWESLIRILAAVALSEAVQSLASLRPLSIREGKDQEPRPCKARDLCSERLAVRIGLIEGVLHRAQDVDVELRISSLVPLELIAEIRRLNVVRNGFSHESTKSNAQAEEIIDEAYSVMLEVLLDLRDMQSVELFRIHAIRPGFEAEIETLTGHAGSRSVQLVRLDPEAAALAMSATPVDGMSRVLARFDGLTLDLSPFFYAENDGTGHRTRILHYVCKKAGKWQMECVADSTSKTSAAAQHEELLGPFEDLLERDGKGA